MDSLGRRDLFKYLLALPVAAKVAYDAETKSKPIRRVKDGDYLTAARWNELVDKVNNL